MPLEAARVEPVRCTQCGADIGPGMLACPSCRRLLHAEQLRLIAAEAEQLQRAGDVGGALASWRQALDLLPQESTQFARVFATVNELSRKVDAGAPSSKPRGGGGAGKGAAVAGAVGILAVIASKLKYAGILFATGGKALIGGLGKSTTLFSMLLAFGLYWKVFGWLFALSLVVLIYVHEMGHVFALRRFGMPASAPMFIPGFGALIRLRQQPVNAIENARVGLAGPLWGTFGSVVSWLIYLVTGGGAWAAIAASNALLNLFNMVPVWQLDGSRGMASLTKKQRWIVVAVAVLMFALTAHQWLLIIAGVGAWRAWNGGAEEGDTKGVVYFSMLLVVLAMLASVAVPLAPERG